MKLEIDLSKDEVDYLGKICALLSCISTDEAIIGCNIASKLARAIGPVDKIADDTPVLDQDLCFKYKGYDFEITSCNCITAKEQMLGLTNENINERFPHGIFSDRYVCWMHGHKDCEGHTKEESDYPDCWAPEVYLVPEAWSWGAESDLKPGLKVTLDMLEMIDKFLETFKE